MVMVISSWELGVVVIMPIAPILWTRYNKPPIIIYQGVKPPVHVYEKPKQSSYKPQYTEKRKDVATTKFNDNFSKLNEKSAKGTAGMFWISLRTFI